MSVLPYEDYSLKDRISDWTGPLPDHWDSRKLKFVADCFASNIDKKSKPGEQPIRLCNYTDVYYNDEISDDLEFMRATATVEQIDKFLLRSGDTIITKDSEDPNDIAVPTFVPETLPGVICAYHLSMIRPTSEMHPKFLNWAFQASYARSFFATRANGLTRYGLGAQALGEWDVPVPTGSEQKQIASFLDYETAKIDALIEKQQQLIALLGEKRQAVISHAVTKGLNPDAPMRDSGVEWLGEVPEHWVTTKVGFACTKIGSGKTPKGGADVYQDEGVMLLRSQNVYDTGLRLKDVAFISKQVDREMSNSRVKPYDILLNITGASLGRTCIVPDGLPSANVNQHVCILRLRNRELCDFLSLFLKGSLMKAQYDLAQNGAAREGLNFEEISRLSFAYPPTQKEREEISTSLAAKSGKLVDAIRAATEMTDLLRERRTALISAAVTGKIDVRGWKPPAADPKKETEMEVA